MHLYKFVATDNSLIGERTMPLSGGTVHQSTSKWLNSHQSAEFRRVKLVNGGNSLSCHRDSYEQLAVLSRTGCLVWAAQNPPRVAHVAPRPGFHHSDIKKNFTLHRVLQHSRKTSLVQLPLISIAYKQFIPSLKGNDIGITGGSLA